jgi:tetratricopeptide (TPR) repeat protein
VPDAVPNSERVRAALDEVLGWQGISRSPQLADLLRYVVDKTLSGDGASIKAYSIAVDVFGRPQEFDPQTDPIVRVQARRLRSLLEQYYASGLSRSGIEIRLPLGRYIPDFVEVGTAGNAPPAAAVDSGATTRPPPPLSPFVSNAMLALIFTLVGVVLAVVLVRWMLPQFNGGNELPVRPGIVIGAFDNLTGEPVLDDDVAQIATRLTTSLTKFGNVTIGSGGFHIAGTVQHSDGRFVLRASLLQNDTLAWTTSIEAPSGVTDTEALTAVGVRLAEQLGNAAGPLHAPGRAWVTLQDALSEPVNSYLCELLYMSWRDSRRPLDAEAGEWCFKLLLKASPDDAVALAASADIASWRIKHIARPTDDLSQLLSNASVGAGRAVTLAPDSSFVHEQQAMVLGRQGSVDAATGAINKAIELNPANMDAMAVSGFLLWSDGQYAEGGHAAERALTALQSPPPWYYLTRALNALREDRFFDAIDAAQAMAAGDDELALIIALTAAPRAARRDLIDRYRPLVLGNSYFQESGIMPRVSMRVKQPGVLQRIRTGLVLAGLPVNTLDRPFNADGSARAPG